MLRKKLFRSQRVLFVIIVLSILIGRSMFVDWYKVPTGSMKPTIFEGDFIFVNRLAYDLKVPFTTLWLSKWGNPKRGEIVVFKSPDDETRLVKRVIGLPGDKIRLEGEQMWINDEIISYYPLPKTRFPSLSEADQNTHTTAAEQLFDLPHPVMFGPEKKIPPIQGEFEIPEGQYFMLGDHRDDSRDSRYFGAIERRRILGHAVSVIVSFNTEEGWKPRWNRFFYGLN